MKSRPAAATRPATPTGTQSVERALLLLREVATRGKTGWGLWDLADRCGLDRGTTHRLLACLVRERMVVQREHNRHYFPGPLLFELGLALPDHAEFQAQCQDSLARISKRFRAVVIHYLKSGADCVCTGRNGSADYTRSGTEIGTRAPLASLAGGVAILIALPPAERAAALAQNARQLHNLEPTERSRLERMLRRSQRLGYALSLGDIFHGVNSFGVATRDPQGKVFGSLLLSGVAAEFPAARAGEVVPALRQQATVIEDAARRILRR